MLDVLIIELYILKYLFVNFDSLEYCFPLLLFLLEVLLHSNLFLGLYRDP